MNRLYTIVGRSNALKMLASSAKIGKNEALKMGLVDEIADFANLKKHSPSYSENHTEEEFEKAFLKVGEDFLKPYLEMPFAGSVCAIKRCVAAIEYEVPEKACARTRALLATRWASADNKKALAGKKVYSKKT
jgi:enoyl-CoA hydratase/carnithine racemase